MMHTVKVGGHEVLGRTSWDGEDLRQARTFRTARTAQREADRLGRKGFAVHPIEVGGRHYVRFGIPADLEPETALRFSRCPYCTDGCREGRRCSYCDGVGGFAV